MKIHGWFLAGLLLLLVGGSSEAELIVAISGRLDDHLIAFSSEAPETILWQVPISGVPVGERIRALDLRPATGELYVASSVCGGVGCTHRLGRIDPASGAVTPFASTFATGPILSVAHTVGLDFDPVADEARVVLATGEQLRLDPDTGAVLGFGTALPPNLLIHAIAYSESHPSATSTTLYALDNLQNQLGTIGGPGGIPSPDGGSYDPIGPPLGIEAGAFAFDISPAGSAFAAAYPTIPFGGEHCPPFSPVSSFVRIDLTTGQATFLGFIGGCSSVSAVAAMGPTPAAAVPALNFWGVFALTAALALTGVIILGERWRRS